jgi:Family of unknown function (DUF6178)
MNDDDAVIPLSRWRAALARARKGRRADALIAEPDAAQLVPNVPVQDLYYAIQEVGLADAQELVSLATPEQVRGLVDLDVWERDQLDEHRLDAWLEALVDIGPEKLAAVIEALDGEVVALWLQRHAHVYDLTLDEVPEEPEGQFYPTPDRFFLLDVLGEGEQQKALQRTIDWIYRADLDLARRVMMSARWELTADLEEHSYRWRTGRMADLGYAEYYDALTVYRFLHPKSVKLDEGTQQPPLAEPVTLPVQLASVLDDKSLYARALATIADDQALEAQQGHLMVLLNRVLAADRVPLSDVEAAQKALGRSLGYLELGLEFLSRGDAQLAGRALATVALERIFRAGFSLTLGLGRMARIMWQSGRLRAPHLLVDPPEHALLLALLEPRPRFSPSDGEAPRDFHTLDDVSRATAALGFAAMTPVLLYDHLKVPPSEAEARIADSAEPETARFGTLVRTLAAHLALGQPPTLAPLDPSERSAFLRLPAETKDAAWQKLREAALGAGAQQAQIDPYFTRWRALLDAPSDPSALLTRLMR